MPNLPARLQPTSRLPLQLPSGRHVELPQCTPTFAPSRQTAPAFTLGGKPLLDYHGTPYFAELLILRLLQEAAWNGVCVQAYGGHRVFDQMPTDWTYSQDTASVPESMRAVLSGVQQRSRSRGGCFDVFCWREDQVLFCEAKLKGKDRLRKTQLAWIDAALAHGIPPTSLLIVEWSLSA
jgi:hypothetical protein